MTSGELDVSTPARSRLATELLGWGAPRPAVPDGLVAALRDALEAGIARVADVLPALVEGRPGRTLTVAKSRLDRLACDGWALEPEPYVHTRANVRGVLTHAVIATDLAADRRDDAASLVAEVWRAEASRRAGDPSSMAAWMNALDRGDAHALRAELTDLLLAFREVWPPLPGEVVEVWAERRLLVPLAGGLVTLRGIPDLVVASRRRDDRARMLVVDLKTGLPRPELERQQLRFYALLTTLASGVPPFRWSTFHVSEGRFEAEDLRPSVLEAAVRRVVDCVVQEVRIAGAPAGSLRGALAGADHEPLRLHGGGWCRFCRLRDDCALSQAPGILPSADGDGTA